MKNKDTSLTSAMIAKYFKVTSKLEIIGDRPQSSLVELFQWTKKNFAPNHQVFVNNKITVNNSLINFCEINDYTISCLYRDSVATWEMGDEEQFIAQGIFRISTKDFSFISCGLFHKGAEYEDEVSFFSLVADEDFDKYISLRNAYEEWQRTSDREAREIVVIGEGETEPIDESLSWDELFLVDDLKNDLRQTIEGFLKSEELYKKRKISYRMGLIFHGEPGNGKTSALRTIFAQYPVKPVRISSFTDNVDEALNEAFDYAEYHGPSVLQLEDLPEMLSVLRNPSNLLQLLDGVTPKHGIIVIATANDLSKIDKNLIDRPSRFDRKFFFDNPNEDLCLKYLKHWFGESFTEEQYMELVKLTVSKKFAFTHLKSLYQSSMHYCVLKGMEFAPFENVKKFANNIMSDRRALRKNGSEESRIRRIIDSTTI